MGKKKRKNRILSGILAFVMIAASLVSGFGSGSVRSEAATVRIDRDQIVRQALSYIGSGYSQASRLGYGNPVTFDCSGLVWRTLTELGFGGIGDNYSAWDTTKWKTAFDGETLLDTLTYKDQNGIYQKISNCTIHDYSQKLEDGTYDSVSKHQGELKPGEIVLYEGHLAIIATERINEAEVNARMDEIGAPAEYRNVYMKMFAERLIVQERLNSKYGVLVPLEVMTPAASSDDVVEWCSNYADSHGIKHKDDDQLGTIHFTNSSNHVWAVEASNINGGVYVSNNLAGKAQSCTSGYTLQWDDATYHFQPQLYKKDNTGTSVSGAIYKIYRDPACTKEVSSAVSAAGELVDFFPVIDLGKSSTGIFYIKETQAPSGCVLDTTVYTINVEGAEDGTSGRGSAVVSGGNKLKVMSGTSYAFEGTDDQNNLANFGLIKVDETIRIGGAKYLVVPTNAGMSAADIAQFIKENPDITNQSDLHSKISSKVKENTDKTFLITTSDSGAVYINGVWYCKTETQKDIYVAELKAPSGYVLDTNVYKVTVSANNKGKNSKIKNITVAYGTGTSKLNYDSSVSYAAASDSPETTSYSVEKKFENGAENFINSIKVQLYRYETDKTKKVKVGDEITLSAEGNWTYSWSELRKKNANGEAYTYLAEEVSVSYVKGYDASFFATPKTLHSSSKTTITNSMRPVKGNWYIKKVDQNGNGVNGIKFNLWYKDLDGKKQPLLGSDGKQVSITTGTLNDQAGIANYKIPEFYVYNNKGSAVKTFYVQEDADSAAAKNLAPDTTLYRVEVTASPKGYSFCTRTYYIAGGDKRSDTTSIRVKRGEENVEALALKITNTDASLKGRFYIKKADQNGNGINGIKFKLWYKDLSGNKQPLAGADGKQVSIVTKTVNGQDGIAYYDISDFYLKDNNNSAVKTFYVQEDADSAAAKNLASDTTLYRIEVTASAKGYTYSTEKYYIAGGNTKAATTDISIKRGEENVKALALKVINSQALLKGNFYIKKVDKVTGKPISGVEFFLWYKGSDGKPHQMLDENGNQMKITTKSNGIAYYRIDPFTLAENNNSAVKEFYVQENADSVGANYTYDDTKYRIKVIASPKGYAYCNREYYISGGNTAALTETIEVTGNDVKVEALALKVENTPKPITGGFAIRKEDDKGSAIPGVSFEIEEITKADISGKIEKTIKTTDEIGMIKIELGEWDKSITTTRTFSVKEIKSADTVFIAKYECDPSTYIVTVAGNIDSSNASVTVTNNNNELEVKNNTFSVINEEKVVYGRFVIKKQDDKDGAIANVGFNIYGDENLKTNICMVTTGTDGTCEYGFEKVYASDESFVLGDDGLFEKVYYVQEAKETIDNEKYVYDPSIYKVLIRNASVSKDAADNSRDAVVIVQKKTGKDDVWTDVKVDDQSFGGYKGFFVINKMKVLKGMIGVHKTDGNSNDLGGIVYNIAENESAAKDSSKEGFAGSIITNEAGAGYFDLPEWNAASGTTKTFYMYESSGDPHCEKDNSVYEIIVTGAEKKEDCSIEIARAENDNFKINETTAYLIDAVNNPSNVTVYKYKKEGDKELDNYEVSTDELVGGCEFAVLNEDETAALDKNGNEVVFTTVQGQPAHLVGVLEYGKTYILRETKSAPGYLMADDVLFTAGIDTEVRLTDDYTAVEISKIELVDGKTKFVDGATLRLAKKDDAGIWWQWTTKKNDDGTFTCIDITNGNAAGNAAASPNNGKMVIECIPAGQYLLTEIAAPNGYAVAESIDVTIKAVGAGIEVQSAVMENKPIVIEISKLDLVDGKPVIGATLTLYNYDEGAEDHKGSVYTSWITKDEKTHTLTRIPAGKYILEETNVPGGYVKAENAEITVFDNKVNERVVMEDDRVYGQIEIEKANQDGEKLSEAVFEVRDAQGNLADTLATDENGYAISKVLPVNDRGEDGKLYTMEYTLTEVKAPAGYEKLEASIKTEISQGNDRTTKILVHKETVINYAQQKLPATGGQALAYWGICGILVFAAGLLFIAGKKKSGKKK